MTKSGDFAVEAEVDSISKFRIMSTSDGYNVPSMWMNKQNDNFIWFAIKNV